MRSSGQSPVTDARARVGGRARMPGARSGPGGFALVMAVMILALLLVVTLGILSLSVVQVRQSSLAKDDLEARANARLAMMLALGELQKQLGPDQRVSAPAAILDQDPDSPAAEGVMHPHWTGVWSSRHRDGGAMWVRNDADGGLRDRRFLEDWDREEASLSYLVSGNEGGRRARAGEFVEASGRSGDLDNGVALVGSGSLGSDPARLKEASVVVPRVAVGRGAGSGHFGYWVGDLGTRANVTTRNPYEASIQGVRRNVQLMASQEASPEVMTSATGEGQRIPEDKKSVLLDMGQLDLLGQDARDWRQTHFHDVTVHSQGVPSNLRDGGLKRDLTAYFQSEEGSVAGLGEAIPGIADADNLVGPANEAAAAHLGLRWEDTLHRNTSPRMGLLRNWSRSGDGVPFGHAEVMGVVPKSEPNPRRITLDGMASSNLNPASIASLDQPNLMPVLVEGSMYWKISWHRMPAGSAHPFNIRLHCYPRVVLWNPYNVELTADEMMVMIQGNGRKEMWIDGGIPFGPWAPGCNFKLQGIWFIGGRTKEYNPDEELLDSKIFNDPYIGSFYYGLEKTTIGPGECLVFSPTRAAEYDELAAENNMLSARIAPDPALNYYYTSTEIDGGIDIQPCHYWFAPTPHFNVKKQADDSRMILKHRGSQQGITPEKFDELPQIAYVSCSLQYGAGREPRVSWNKENREKMEETNFFRPRPAEMAATPNVRTRDGIRMRWFEEHPSNIGHSGALQDQPHFESALLANWNPRAAYSFRTPWENLAGQVAADGSGSGPWFFGAYTRDLYDQAVSWNDMAPVPRNGKFHGNPFGQPMEGQARYVLYDVPRRETGVLSIGQFQHAKLSEFAWHPSYAVGQSLVDPRVGRATTAPVLGAAPGNEDGGWNPGAIGWDNDAPRNEWAQFGRALGQNYAETDHLVYDLSYEANYSLWDDFFLSTGSGEQKVGFLHDATAYPLPNGRHVLAPSTRGSVTDDRLQDFHRAAYHLLVDGSFNVNSTSVSAWKAMLASTRNTGSSAGHQTPFPRFLNPPEGEWNGGSAFDEGAWAGMRSLTDQEVGRLAEAIVQEVKRRGPFLTLADFVNRRLVDDETGRMGPLQAAIERAGLNAVFEDAFPLHNQESLPDFDHPDNIDDSTRLEQTLKPSSKAWGAPGYLTQGDLLQVLGPALTARSDTFVIRTYGDAVDAQGKVRARAWCEAVVQRTPRPIHPDATGLNSARNGEANDFGRQFVIRSFRWLTPDEI